VDRGAPSQRRFVKAKTPEHLKPDRLHNQTGSQWHGSFELVEDHDPVTTAAQGCGKDKTAHPGPRDRNIQPHRIFSHSLRQGISTDWAQTRLAAIGKA